MVSSQPVVQQVSCYPSEPTPQSNVTFVVGINSSNCSIDQVCLIAQECMDDLCSIYSQNLSMNYTYSCCMDFYEAEFKGEREDATQIKYHVEILSNGSWYVFETGFIDLLDSPDNNIDDNKKNTTPGFEIVLILFSIILFLIVKKRNL
jgi:hypothetical protein